MKTILASIRVLTVMTILTGVVYPLCVTLLSKALFAEKAGGSIVSLNGIPRGSALVAQKFSSEKYFWPRPSACDYSTVPSGGENRSLANRRLKEDYDARMKYWQNAVPENWIKESKRIIPPDMLFASASGLDPHISPESAYMQLDRVARECFFSEKQKDQLKELIEKRTEKPILGFIGERRVNVLLLNMDMDGMK